MCKTNITPKNPPWKHTWKINPPASPSSFEDDDFPFPKDMHPPRSLEGRSPPPAPQGLRFSNHRPSGKSPRAPMVTGTAATVPATGHSAVGRWWPCRRWRWDLPCSKGKADLKEMNYFTKFVWRHLLIYGWFPKMVVFPPNHPISIGFSIIFTIHFGVFPLFLETPIYLEMVDVL